MNNKVFGNYNLKVGDILSFEEELIGAPGFYPGKKGVIVDFGVDDYITIKRVDEDKFITEFHIESQNAEMCRLDKATIRNKKINNLLDN
jgi:hypothetical protein